MSDFAKREMLACISKIRAQWSDQFREATFVYGYAEIIHEDPVQLLRTLDVQMFLILDYTEKSFSRYIPNYLTIEKTNWTLNWADAESFDDITKFETSEYNDENFDCENIAWDNPKLPEEVIEVSKTLFDQYGISEEFFESGQNIETYLETFPNCLKLFVRTCVLDWKNNP